MVVVGAGSMVSGVCATVLPSAELLARVAGASAGIDAVARVVGSGVETAGAVGVDAVGGMMAGAAGGAAGWLMVLSRNDAAMADSDPLAGTPSSLAKSESMRTLAATALIALPPGGTVPRASAVVVARRPFPFSLPKVGSADPLPEMSANSRRLTAGSVVVPWDDGRVAEARAASCAARAAAATNPAGVSGSSNFVSNCSSALMMHALGTFVMPKRRVASGFASTSTQTGSKQAPMRATASSLASVVRSRVVVAELQLAVKIAITGRWLISDARRAVARSGCHGMAAEALAVHAENSVSAAAVASRRQVWERVGIGITMQVEDITPASGPCGHLGTTGTNERREPKSGRVASGTPSAVHTNIFRPGRCIGRNGRRNRIENAIGSDFGGGNSLQVSPEPLFIQLVLPGDSPALGSSGVQPLDNSTGAEDTAP